MMPSRSTPNLQQVQPTRELANQPSPQTVSNGHQPTATIRDDDSPPPAPPVRDASSLKSIKYGPGHEKFPSWPVPAAADTPQALKAPPGGGSHRSKSWTDHTNYPKEKVVTYTRPYMKRQHSSHIQQKLKTVLEKCEKIPPETFESRFDKLNDCMYLPHVDRDGKPLGDMEYTVPSPPERDINKPQLTQEELEEYARSYHDTTIEKFGHYNQDMKGLENFIEYARSYEEFHIKQHDDNVLTHLHQKQLSYAQSEGYHSYVSSTDSTSTPFLDRLRRDSEAVTTRWEDDQENLHQSSRREGRDSVVTTSSGSASSSETLKWHGSMSDVSVASSCTHLANSSNSSVQRQHIAHSARVQTPQRHYSESVLQKNGDSESSTPSSSWKDKEKRNNSNNKLKLFAVNTYTVQSDDSKTTPTVNSSNSTSQLQNRLSQPLPLSVADRINELEKQQKYSYLDPNKKHKVPDPTLKAIQKKALLSFYERHHNATKTSTWRSEPQLAQAQPALTVAPQPPPRVKSHQTPSRRASCASDYSTSKRSSLASRDSKENPSGKITPRHQHSNSCGSLSTDLLGPVIVGPSISLDDWVPEKPPERPPKNPHLRLAYPDLFQDQRVPSPDLPPPSPPTVLEDEVIQNDEPLPPPPPEIENTTWKANDFDETGGRLQEANIRLQEINPRLQETNPRLQETNPRLQETNSRLQETNPRLQETNTRLQETNPRLQEISTTNTRLQDTNARLQEASATSSKQYASPQVQSSRNNNKLVNDDLCVLEPPKKPLIGLPERGNPRYSSVRHLPSEQHKMAQQQNSEGRHSLGDTSWFNDTSKKHHKSPTSSKDHQQIFSFPNHRNYERSSTRYPSVHKLVLNGNVAVSQKISNGINEYRAEPLRTINPTGPENTLKDNSRNHGGNNVNQRASIAEGPSRDVPPPLQPRQMRINQSMRARIPESRSGVITRGSPPRDDKLRDARSLNYTMSQSKASYLASRRDRDKIIPDPDSGSYKRTISPNGHIITSSDMVQEAPKLTSRETWSVKSKEQYTNNNNGSIMRRSSVCEQNKNADMKDELKKSQAVVLPDVLPMNAKIIAPRSQQLRPSNLSLSPHIENFSPSKSPPKSPPSSPPKSPSRNSPYAPLRSTNLSNSPLRTPSLRLSPQGTSSPITSTPQYATPLRIYPSAKDRNEREGSSMLLSSPSESRPTSLSLQRNEAKIIQRASLQEIRTSNNQRLSPSTSPSTSVSPNTSSSSSQSMSLPASFSPPPSLKNSPPKLIPEIKPTLSPNLSNKTTPIKVASPSTASTITPLKTSPDSSPPSSPKVLSSPPPSPKGLSIAPSPPESPKEIVTPKVIEGLQMIQRTEVVLRVNTTTIDASSQTEKEELPPTPLPTRRKLQEEIDCEKLSQDFISQLPVTDKLKDLLVPAPEHKKITDYVTGLFRVDVTLKPRPANAPFRSRNNTPSSTPPPVCNSGPASSTSTTSDTISIISSLEPTSPLPATSPYFTTSEPKAKFLTRYSQDMSHYTIKNTKDLNRKKDELVNRLDRKLEVLRGEQLVVSEECRINDELGQNVEDHIGKVARPTETAKFRLHIEEVGKITSLLLGLSGRLARVENALMGMSEDNPEKRILETKRDKLLDQLEEAKKLKESIDKRSVSVSNILYKYLNSEEYADYDHFINMKAKLIMDSKDIADKIKLGEEQLLALKETLIVTD